MTASKIWKALGAAGLVAGSVLGIDAAQAATIAWRVTPVLGFDHTALGPCPAGSNWINCATVTTDTGVIVVPAVTDPTDPYFGQGLPSQPIFTLDTGIHGTAWAASAVDKPVGGSFDITILWSYLGPSGPWSTPVHEGVDGNSGTVVNYGNAFTFNDYPALPDEGFWTYTETWTNIADATDFITASTPFCVTGPNFICTGPSAVVPEPGSLALLGLGLAAFGFGRRKKVQAE